MRSRRWRTFRHRTTLSTLLLVPIFVILRCGESDGTHMILSSPNVLLSGDSLVIPDWQQSAAQQKRRKTGVQPAFVRRATLPLASSPKGNDVLAIG